MPILGSPFSITNYTQLVETGSKWILGTILKSNKTITMPHKKKTGKGTVNILNFSDYAFVQHLPPFQEADRFLESELSQLSCYNDYVLEASLSQFSNGMLNNNLCTMYRKGWLERLELMHKLLTFFVKRYHGLLVPMVEEYLNSKKLSMEDWLKAVKEGHHGDIVCVLFLSMITGQHTHIHLK